MGTGGGPPNPGSGRAPAFEFSADEPASFQCRLDAGDWAACSSPQAYEQLADGEHAFAVRATDRAGNLGAAASYGWTVDTVGPAVTIDGAPSNPSNDRAPSFEFSAGEPASFQCRLDAGDWAACTSPQGYAELSDGAHSFAVRATDRAGNLGAAASYSWTVDTVAPTTTIDDAPPNPSSDRSPVFEFSADEPASFECRLDVDEWGSCSNPEGLTDGEHSFAVRATDRAGNLGGAASYSWTVDTVAPAVTIDDGPPALGNSTAASFEFGADEPANFQCRLDAGDWAACT